MSNKPFDRTISNTREKLISGDFNLMQTYSDLAVREQLLRTHSPRTSISSDVLDRSYDARFASDGFKVRPTSPTGMSVRVTAGMGFVGSPTDTQTNIDSVTGLNDTSALKPVVLTEEQEFVVPSNPGLLTRIDIIEVAYNKEAVDSEPRDVLNQSSGSFQITAVNKTFSWALDGLTGSVIFPLPSNQPLSYKKGSSGGGVPPTTSGYTKIAEIYVDPGTTTIEEANVADFRKLLCPSGYMTVSAKISLPNVNASSIAQPIADLKPTVLSLSAPAGVSVSCYPVTNKKTYDFIITGNFSSVDATVRAVGSFDEIISFTLSQFSSKAVDARIRSSQIDDIGTTRATAAANPSIANPVVSLSSNQRAAIINFCPYQIVLDGSSIEYKTIVSSADADPMTVSLIAVLKY